ncbi:MAG: phospholipid carrier-dependent glycosyltransferase, partial [Rhodospirillales bacterium]|nr:phospholipid carrier-dependent glycosyltransferase [Rhodospirillales bacterium]
MSFLFVLVLSFLLVGLGWSLIMRLDPAGRFNSGERLALAFLIGCFGVYYGVFLIGLFRLDAISMWSLVAVIALAAAPGIQRMPWGLFLEHLRDETRVAKTDPWVGGLWLTLILIALSSLLQGMAPPNDYDSLMYHMSQPQFDIEMGRLSIPWDRALGTELFPAMAGHLSRLSLATMNAGVAQMLHGVLGLVAALGAAMLTGRLGFGRCAALLTAIFFLATRVVIWEMGSVEVDVPLAAFTVLAILSYHSFRQSGDTGAAILFGLMIGGGILVKYHGFIVALSFGPIIAHDLFRRRVAFIPALLGPLVALLTLLPHTMRNFLITGNPVYPLLNKIFNPDKHEFFQMWSGGYGTGRDLVDFLSTPWNMFISPMHLFDGMIFGAPFLLAFAPLLILDPKNLRRWSPILVVAGCYYLGWFYLLDGQVRFLLPIMPVLAAMAAVGVGVMWRSIGNRVVLRAAFLSIAMILAVNQALFVGIYSLLRLPVALGFMDPSTYHLKTPTMNGAFYETCGY